MPYTPEEKREVHLKMYGVPDINEYIEGLIMKEQIGAGDYQSLAISILSDVQELTSLCDTGNENSRNEYIESARKLTNIAKKLISMTREQK